MSVLVAREASEASLRLAYSAAAEERRQEEERLAEIKAEEEVSRCNSHLTLTLTLTLTISQKPTRLTLAAAHRLHDRAAEERGEGGPGEGGAEAEGGGGEEGEGGEGGGELEEDVRTSDAVPPYHTNTIITKRI